MCSSFFCKCMLYQSSPEMLDAKGVILRQGDTMNGSTALQVKTVTWPLWNPHNFQKAKKWAFVHARIIDPDYQRGSDYCSTVEVKEYIWNADLLASFSLNKVNGKLLQFNSGRTTKDLHPLRMKMWLPDKEQWPVEGLVEWKQKLYRANGGRR